MTVLYVMSSGTPEENLQQIFRVFDINNDGKISVAEVRKIGKDLFSLINDDNSDIDNQKLLVNSAFSEMDENCDGEVSIEEFIQVRSLTPPCMQASMYTCIHVFAVPHMHACIHLHTQAHACT